MLSLLPLSLLSKHSLVMSLFYVQQRTKGLQIGKHIAVLEYGKLIEASAPVCWAFTPQFDRDYAQMCIA